MFRQKPPMQLLTDGWCKKLLPNKKADAPCDVTPNPTRNTPIVIMDTYLCYTVQSIKFTVESNRNYTTNVAL